MKFIKLNMVNYLNLFIHFEIIGIISIILKLFDNINTSNLCTHKHLHPGNSLHHFYRHFNAQATMLHFFNNIHKHSETFTYADIHIQGICYTKIIDFTTYKIQNYT